MLMRLLLPISSSNSREGILLPQGGIISMEVTLHRMSILGGALRVLSRRDLAGEEEAVVLVGRPRARGCLDMEVVVGMDEVKALGMGVRVRIR